MISTSRNIVGNDNLTSKNMGGVTSTCRNLVKNIFTGTNIVDKITPVRNFFDKNIWLLIDQQRPGLALHGTLAQSEARDCHR